MWLNAISAGQKDCTPGSTEVLSQLAGHGEVWWKNATGVQILDEKKDLAWRMGRQETFLEEQDAIN